jgi:hypothetical protein
MPSPPDGLSVTGYPKGGRPPKIANPHRWHLIVDRTVRDRAENRAARRGEELTDVMRALLADYAAGRTIPHGLPAAREEP